MKNKNYVDEKFGDFKFTDWPYGDPHYYIENYKTGKYFIGILNVYTNNESGLKKCLKKLKNIFQKIDELDDMARKSFSKELDATEEDLNEIEIDNLYYYENGNFELFYNLPEEELFEYVSVIFDENFLVIDTTASNY